jgi:hypothetical protein
MTEQDLHEYNKWLMKVWNPNQLYIPFAIDAPKAFLDHRSKVKNLSSNTVLADRLPNAEDVKRWYQLLVGKGEIEMQKDIEATLR